MATGRAKDHVIGQGDEFPQTPIQRWDANVRALRLLKDLEREKRKATDAEQEVLGQYSGFGDSAFEQAFSYYSPRDSAWKSRREELETLVSEDELEGIRRSRVNAFYTTPKIIRTMWEGLSAMGADRLDNPKVLEPSAGSGRFLGLQPQDTAAKSSRTAVELDPLTADVLGHLYPETRVFKMGYQEAPLPDNHYDIAVSNVPFGDIRVNDPDFNRTGRRWLSGPIHNYFFAKTLDKLRPGGVMAFITSHNTMNAPSHTEQRRYLSERADLLGAVRLPEDAFPDTDVVTDIIYLRKRDPESGPGDDSWVESERISAKDKYGYDRPVNVNRYFLNNPDKVLGKHSAEGSMYAGASYTVKSDPLRPVATDLARETGEIGRAAPTLGTRPRAAVTSAVVAPRKSAQPSRYELDDGKLVVARGNEKGDHELSEKDAERVATLVDIRDTARELVTQEASGAVDSSAVEATRKTLREKYDAYLDEYDEAINAPANRKLLGKDADTHLLFALEAYDKDSECWQPADIMTKRVVGAVAAQRAASPADALTLSLNESGRVDFERMGKMLERDPAEVRDELADERLIFRSADGSAWVPAAEYLSGNVVGKLTAARKAATADPTYGGNVEALEAVQPEKIYADDISTPLGAPWIPADVVNEWVKENWRPYVPWNKSGQFFQYTNEGEAFVGQDAKGKNKAMGTSGGGGSWTLAQKIDASDAMLRNKWGTEQMSAKDILLKTLQGAPISVTQKNPDGTRSYDPEGTLAAQQKAEEMQKSFEEWVWQDAERRERLEDLYNDAHNSIRQRLFDGSHQTFPGMSAKWQRQMRPHQQDAIYRVVNDGTALLAHEVGFGKTATMVAAAMERKRLGLANKPVFVVPKATHEQFIDDFLDIYPGARLLAPDATDFQKGNREQFLTRIATGDWDGVILSTEQFEKIPLSAATEAKWIRKQQDEMRSALTEIDTSSAEGKRTQKQISKRLLNYTARLEELRDRMRDRSDDAQTFESLGIDSLYVDEADRYKNLPYVTRMTAGRGGVKGLPQSQSQRAWDMYMKIRHLQEVAGEKPDGSFAKGGVVFATGTPIANTIAEAWTMMRYLQPGEMKRKGLESFDAWAKTYGQVSSGIEQTAVGTYKPVQRFNRFVNLPELSQLFQNVADIRVASEVPEMVAQQPVLIGPEGEQGKRITVVAPSHPALESYMADVVKRVDKLGTVDPTEDNMLKISSDARKASLDVRMVNPKAPYNPESKTALAAENIARIHKEEEADKGTQLVFLDFGTPKAKEGKDTDEDAPPGADDLTGEELKLLSNVYGALRNELKSRGVPEDQIAFIHDYKTNTAREDLFDDVRKGDVRVLVGSTDKIGVGVNVQDRAAAAHHIDVPWRPRGAARRANHPPGQQGLRASDRQGDQGARVSWARRQNLPVRAGGQL